MITNKEATLYYSRVTKQKKHAQGCFRNLKSSVLVQVEIYLTHFLKSVTEVSNSKSNLKNQTFKHNPIKSYIGSDTYMLNIGGGKILKGFTFCH